MHSKRVLLSVGAVMSIAWVLGVMHSRHKNQGQPMIQQVAQQDAQKVLAAQKGAANKPKKTPTRASNKLSQTPTKTVHQKKLLWREDFSGATERPNTKYWNVATPKMPIYNDEKQIYKDDTASVRVADNKLILEARQTAAGITSGRIDTKAKLAITEGSRLEARIKLPKGKGTWPAFWLLSANQPHTTKLNPTDADWQSERFYMRDGEIDIMEAYGTHPGVVEATVHTFAHSSENQRSLADSAERFHVYWLEWHRDKLVFGVDDNAYHSYKRPKNEPLAWPFTKENQYYIILNLAMGGTGGGEIVSSTGDKWRMEVDYVKYYRL